jgi:hypothetical protein
MGYNKCVFARPQIDTANGEKAVFTSGHGLVGRKRFFDSQQRWTKKTRNTKHAYPQWTLTFISQVLWNEGTKMDSISGKLAGAETLSLYVN